MKKSAQKRSQGLKVRERQVFTVEAGKAIVEEIDNGLSKSEAGRRYQISLQTIYNWLGKYSKHYTAAVVKVVEHKSQADQTRKLQAELDQAYILNGKLSAALALAMSVIERADAESGSDLKKSLGTSFSWISTTPPKAKK